MIKAEVVVKDNRIWVGNYLILWCPSNSIYMIHRVEPAKNMGTRKHLEHAIKYCLEN